MAFGEAERKEQAHAVGAPEIEILADDGFEEVPALHRPIEDLGEADLDLLEREAMVVAGGAVGGGHRPGQRAAQRSKKACTSAGPSAIADGLQTRSGRRRRESRCRDCRSATPARRSCCFTHSWPLRQSLIGIRQVGADLQERRPPVAILDVEVVVIDGDRLPREVERDRLPRGPRRFCALNARIFSCATPITTTPSSIGRRARYVRDHVVFALARARTRSAGRRCVVA